MMKPVLDFAKQIVSLTNDVKQCKADILKLEQGQKEIAAGLYRRSSGTLPHCFH